MSLAVSLAVQDGVQVVACASTGEAGVALAAYAAAAGVSAHVYLARYEEPGCQTQIHAYGAILHRVDDPAQALAEAPESWRKVSGDEGSKTLGYELCEQLGWQYPDAILAPADVLNVLSLAFEDLERAGLATGKPPSLYPVLRAGQAKAHEGLLLCPAGAAGVTAYEILLQSSRLAPKDRVVLINPSAGALGMSGTKLPWSMPVGGIITPV